jgi:hypothetical protein
MVFHSGQIHIAGSLPYPASGAYGSKTDDDSSQFQFISKPSGRFPGIKPYQQANQAEQKPYATEDKERNISFHLR